MVQFLVGLTQQDVLLQQDTVQLQACLVLQLDQHFQQDVLQPLATVQQLELSVLMVQLAHLVL